MTHAPDPRAADARAALAPATPTADVAVPTETAVTAGMED